jgi:branched-subunit amino acid aminotransferase/4-amino-4-deoxychorismate lyase
MSSGPALIETVRIRGGRAPLWPLHLARLERSCRALAIPVPRLEPPIGEGDRVVRLLVTRGGVASAERAVPGARPIRVAQSAVPHPGYPHKTVARDAFDRALRAAPDADEAILATADGWVAEGAVSAVFWWEGDRVAGPPLELGILPSVARARIAQLAGPVLERRIRMSELSGRPLFLANAARGIMEVASWQGESVAPDARTESLGETFWP